MSAAISRASGLSVGKNSTMQSQSFSSCQYGSKSSLRFLLKIARSPGLFTLPTPKLAVQGRYNQSLHLRVSSRSLQGVAERPLPCNYNVIQPISALSRRCHRRKGSVEIRTLSAKARCVLFVSFAVRCGSISPTFSTFLEAVHAGLLIVKLLWRLQLSML